MGAVRDNNRFDLFLQEDLVFVVEWASLDPEGPSGIAFGGF